MQFLVPVSKNVVESHFVQVIEFVHSKPINYLF